MKRTLKIFAVTIAMLVSMTTICINSFAISSPKLTKAAITLLVGESYQLYVNRAVESISWSTSNSKIANVSKGKVTAKSIGTATITAKHGTKSLKCTVTVTDRSLASGKSFNEAIFFNVGDTIENQYKMTENQEHVYYKFKTSSAGDYTITLSHPKDYFGSPHAIFLISDSGKNHVSKEEWFTGETSKTYTLKGNSVYYLETWDYVIFSIEK